MVEFEKLPIIYLGSDTNKLCAWNLVVYLLKLGFLMLSILLGKNNLLFCCFLNKKTGIRENFKR